MSNQTIGDIYANNDKIREKTKHFTASLTDEQMNALPDGETWTIAQIIEHIAIVQDGMMRISAKLLTQAKAAGVAADGAARLSDNFKVKAAEAATLKFEAPDRIHPTGNQSVEESLRKMDETRGELEKLRPLFESVECSDYKFPHPFMGDLTAHDWLTLIGGHEMRHLKQIEKRLPQVEN